MVYRLSCALQGLEWSRWAFVANFSSKGQHPFSYRQLLLLRLLARFVLCMRHTLLLAFMLAILNLWSTLLLDLMYKTTPWCDENRGWPQEVCLCLYSSWERGLGLSRRPALIEFDAFWMCMRTHLIKKSRPRATLGIVEAMEAWTLCFPLMQQCF